MKKNKKNKNETPERREAYSKLKRDTLSEFCETCGLKLKEHDIKHGVCPRCQSEIYY